MLQLQEQNTQQKTHSDNHQAILQSIVNQQRRLGMSSDFLNNPTSFDFNFTTINFDKMSNNDSNNIIAYQTALSKFFRFVHKKRSEKLPIILSQLMYLQRNTNENYDYIDEEKNNFLQVDQTKRTYDYGYITGHKLQDIGDKCGNINKSIVSRNIADLEKWGYLTKRAVVDSTTDSKYSSDERIHIRLNLVNLFKDLIRSGITNLDEKAHLLFDEYKELYTYIKHVIIHIDNIELAKKHSANIDPNQVKAWTLVECYARMKNEMLNSPAKHITIKNNLEKILQKYDVPTLILALDNYEIFRHIANRHERYMLSTAKFFTLENIENFVEPSFNDYLICQDLMEPSANKLKSGFKTISTAKQMLLKRKIHETDTDQIMLDNCVRRLRCSTPTKTLISTPINNYTATTVSKVTQVVEPIIPIEPSIKEFVDNCFNNGTAQKRLKSYYSSCHYKQTHSLEDITHDAYIIALELQAKNKYSDYKELIKQTTYALRKHLALSNDNAISVDDTIIDYIEPNVSDSDLQITFDNWDIAHIFDLDHSNKKVLCQILFCLATNDKTTSTFAKEYKTVLNLYFFDFHTSEKDKMAYMIELLGYHKRNSVIELLNSILSCVNQHIIDYLQIKRKKLSELILSSDLLKDDDICSIYVDTDKIEVLMSDVTDNKSIVNASQIVDVPALHNVDSEFYGILTYISYKMNSSTVNNSLKKRIK